MFTAQSSMIAMRSEQSKYASVDISIYPVSHCTNALISSSPQSWLCILIGDYKHPSSFIVHASLKQSLPQIVTSCEVFKHQLSLTKVGNFTEKKGMGVSPDQTLLQRECLVRRSTLRLLSYLTNLPSYPLLGS